MRQLPRNDPPRARRHSGTTRAVLTTLALAAALAACTADAPWRSLHAQPPEASAAREAATTSAKAAERKLRYVELSYTQMARFAQRIPLDEERRSYGALSAAAIAAETTAGKPGRSAARSDAVRWVAGTLDECTGQWNKVNCERALLSLQRVALQYAQVLPPDLQARLRTEAATFVPPPNEEAIRNPWLFKETENQRAVRIARCLAAMKVEPGPEGSPRAAAADAWGRYAEAFLLAHDREGWYEAESPGYIGTSMTALLQLADHAPQESVRRLAARQLDLLFAEWAQEQVNGFPAGAKSRTYVHWALGPNNTRWPAWAWLAAGLGEAAKISFKDSPEIGTSSYEIPEPVRRLVAERRSQAPYEIRARRRIPLPERLDLDTALYSYATPDYILGTSQSVGGLRLGVSGGQEIMATLYASGSDFAPVYLWSRTNNVRSGRWKSFAGQDLAVGHRNVAVARLAAGEGAEGTGHAYLAPAWSRPEPAGESGEVVVSRYGDTYVALVTEGGWDVAPAPDRFPGYYGGDKAFRGSWAAVPRRQPAAIALEAGRKAEDGDFQAWKKRIAAARLTVVDGELRFTASDGTRLAFLPGERATVGGKALDLDYPLLAGPFLSSQGQGRWMFSFAGRKVEYETIKGGAEAPPRTAPRPASSR